MMLNPSQYRRFFLLGLVGLSGCDQVSEAMDLDGSWAKLSEEDKALKHKFRGLQGGELTADAFGEKHGVNISDESGKKFYQSSLLSAKNNSRHSYSANFGVPKTLHAVWRDPAVEYSGDPLTGQYTGGRVIANYIVPVASRIPTEVLDAVRSKKGGFRLKIRLHDDGLLIGWDIESRPGYIPGGSYVPPIHSMAGGDFREAEIVDGKAVRKGWYIHPVTKQRIETDF